MLNVNTTKITIADETRECLSRQMMLTYSVWYGNVIISVVQMRCNVLCALWDGDMWIQCVI